MLLLRRGRAKAESGLCEAAPETHAWPHRGTGLVALAGPTAQRDHVVPVLTVQLRASRTCCDGCAQEEAGAVGPRCRAGDEAGDGIRDAWGLNAGASGRHGSEPLVARGSRVPWALLAMLAGCRAG
jgi:hypothetical protein